LRSNVEIEDHVGMFRDEESALFDLESSMGGNPSEEKRGVYESEFRRIRSEQSNPDLLAIIAARGF